jgi:hypothetical protein
MTDIHANQIGYLVGEQGILPAIGRLEITGKTIDDGVAFDGDMEVEMLVIAKEKGGRQLIGLVIERNILHLKPEVFTGSLHFDMTNDTSRISPDAWRSEENCRIQLFDPFSDSWYEVRGAHDAETVTKEVVPGSFSHSQVKPNLRWSSTSR